MTIIESLTLPLPNPVEVAAWYKSLGFQVRRRGLVYHVEIGFSKLKLIHGNEPSWFHVAFHLQEEAFDEYVKRLEKKIPLLPANPDGTFVREFPSWEAHSVYAHDPAGNIIEWISRPGYAWSEMSAYLPPTVGIAEIGIPVSDVGATQHRAGIFLPEWKPGSDEFAIMGATEGLLLIVKEGRGWLPTGRPAKSFPCKGVINHKGRKIGFSSGKGGIWIYLQ